MTSYDYYDAMKEDIREYLEENGAIDRLLADDADRDEIEEELRNELWTADSVTGNASGSYTFNRLQAREYVIDNMDLLNEAIEAFCIDAETVADKFTSENWEYFDVTIRCYVLSEAIEKAVDEFLLSVEIPQF